jgi:hypothetical protein
MEHGEQFSDVSAFKSHQSVTTSPESTLHKARTFPTYDTLLPIPSLAYVSLYQLCETYFFRLFRNVQRINSPRCPLADFWLFLCKYWIRADRQFWLVEQFIYIWGRGLSVSTSIIQKLGYNNVWHLLEPNNIVVYR